MGRACCVSTCDSGTNVPVHLFPKNSERRKLWLQSLQMQPVEEHEIRKLRVCCKHFCTYDYNCSPTRRILKSTAIPSLRISSTNENTTTVNTNTVKSEQNTVPNLVQYKNNEQIQNKQLESQLPKQEELILQDQDNKYVEQIEKQQQELREQEIIVQQHKERLLYQIKKLQQKLRENIQHEEKIQQHIKQLLHQIEKQQRKLEERTMQQHKEQMLYQTEEQQQDLRVAERIMQQYKERMLYQIELLRQHTKHIEWLKNAVAIVQQILRCAIPNPDLGKIKLEKF